MKKLFASALLTISIAASGGTLFSSGGDLVSALNSKDEGDVAIAAIYIVGVHDALQDIVVCTKKDVDPKLVVDYVRKNITKVSDESLRKTPAEVVIGSILGRGFPCGKPV